MRSGKCKIEFMFIFFILSKIILTVAAIFFITEASPWLVLVFALFIFVDVADSKIMGFGYRPYDSFFDRFFAYTCFFAFMASADAIYPAIVYIAAFVMRDYFLLVEIRKEKNYTVRSNMLDRGTMLATAVFFALQAGNIVSQNGIITEFLCYLLAVLIVHQGLEKAGRIREMKAIAESES